MTRDIPLLQSHGMQASNRSYSYLGYLGPKHHHQYSLVNLPWDDLPKLTVSNKIRHIPKTHSRAKWHLKLVKPRLDSETSTSQSNASEAETISYQEDFSKSHGGVCAVSGLGE
ncbi:hypothetical protein DMENIID0001_034140 [Sergentomyia squamirostris]